MNFEEQISAFMDGALTAQEETEFLHILSVSPEKRALFHSYQGVRAAFVSNTRTAAVPSALDAAILGAAGLTIGAAAGAGTAGAGTGLSAGTSATSSAWFRTAGRSISAILLGLSFFTGGWYLHDWLSADAQEQLDAAGHERPVAPSQDGSTEQPRAEEAAQAPARIVYRNVVVTRVDTVWLPRPDAIAGSDVRAAAEPRVEYRYDTVMVALMQTAPDSRPITIVERQTAAPTLPLPGRFELEVQRTHLTTWPYIDYGRIGVERAQQHVSASVGYVFSDRHAVGITAGETSFAMEYYRVENDSLFLFQRQPALFYGAGFYRYSQPLLPGLTPEISLLLGGCDYGPVLGVRLGVRIDALEPLSLLVGVNGALLTYQYKDNLFNSHNLGLTYGIRYRF